MIEINLLPWRDQYRQQLNRRIIFRYLTLVLFLMLAMIFTGAVLERGIRVQQHRNNFLQTEIDKLSHTIAEVKGLQKGHNIILARMSVIQKLQQDRSWLVKLLDDLVHRIPRGIYLKNLQLNTEVLQIEGIAQSNSSVSALLSNLQNSPSFNKAQLQLVKTVNINNQLISQFGLTAKTD